LLRALSKIWWLLALCGILDAMCAAMNLMMLNPDGSPTLRRLALPNTVWDMSMLALVAGACAIIAGLWNSGRGSSWLLSLHGLALGSYGLIGTIPALVRGPLSFRPISLLFVLMAVSVGAFALRAAQTLRSAPDKWFCSVLAAASIAFAFAFIAVAFGWLWLGPPQSFWIWMSSYFGLCATFMLYLALRARSGGISPSSPREILPPIRSPRHAH